jgi:hypothetical protein
MLTEGREGRLHRLNMESDLQVYLGSMCIVHKCTHWLRDPGHPPPFHALFRNCKRLREFEKIIISSQSCRGDNVLARRKTLKTCVLFSSIFYMEELKDQ